MLRTTRLEDWRGHKVIGAQGAGIGTIEDIPRQRVGHSPR